MFAGIGVTVTCEFSKFFFKMPASESAVPDGTLNDWSAATPPVTRSVRPLGSESMSLMILSAAAILSAGPVTTSMLVSSKTAIWTLRKRGSAAPPPPPPPLPRSRPPPRGSNCCGWKKPPPGIPGFPAGFGDSICVVESLRSLASWMAMRDARSYLQTCLKVSLSPPSPSSFRFRISVRMLPTLSSTTRLLVPSAYTSPKTDSIFLTCGCTSAAAIDLSGIITDTNSVLPSLGRSAMVTRRMMSLGSFSSAG